MQVGQLKLWATQNPRDRMHLREEITSLYTSVTVKDVVVAAPQELVAMGSLAMLRPGDHIVATFPGYQALYEIASTIGCEVSFWECSGRCSRRVGFPGL